MARSMGARPSDLLGKLDEFTAFCVDRAVWTFGTNVETAMDEAEERLPKNSKEKARRNARQRALDRMLGVERYQAPRKG